MDFLERVEAEARGCTPATIEAPSGGGGDRATATAEASGVGNNSSSVGDGAESPKKEKKKPVVCIIMGMAGSGKTTLLQRLHIYTAEKGIRSYFINLDPAVKQVPFGASIDIRDTVNYKEVMSQYGLGPNGAITTSLNLFATRFDQVLGLLEKRSDELDWHGVTTRATKFRWLYPYRGDQCKTMTLSKQGKPCYVFIDTPGQIEVFTWSASGQIITETLASAFPTTLVYVVDTPRTANPTTFMSNMLYACSVLYKSRLPLVLALNKSDILSPKFALEWMADFEKLQEALDSSGDDSYMNSLNRSLSLVLDEFYNALTAVGVSAASGDGMPELFKAFDDAALEFDRDYRPDLERRVAEAKTRQEAAKQRHMEKLMADIAVSSGEKVPPGTKGQTTQNAPAEATAAEAATAAATATTRTDSVVTGEVGTDAGSVRAP